MNVADDISQAERRRIMADERRGRTYQGHAMSIDQEMGGRYSKVHPTTVTGSTSVPSYPAQPPGSPWASNPLPVEPPLGYAIDEQEPTGERFEVERSKGGTANVVYGPKERSTNT